MYEGYRRDLLGLTDLPTMHQRIGNRYWTMPASRPQTIFCKDASRNFQCVETHEQENFYIDSNRWITGSSPLWARIEGSYSHMKYVTAIDGGSYGASSFKMQAGLDGLLYESAGSGRLVGGVTLNYNQGAANFNALSERGEIKSQGYGVGGTLTWLEPDGFYVDGQASATWFDSTLQSYSGVSQIPLATEIPGFGYALSLETGKKIDIDDGWAVTPQVQLTLSSVNFDLGEGQSGGGERLRARLGILLANDQNWMGANGMVGRSHVYGLANLDYEFLDSTEDTERNAFSNDGAELWGGIGVGASFNWDNDKYGVYGEISARTGLTNIADNYAVTGTVGLRVKF